MNVYIPEINLDNINKKHLFVLTRPFLVDEKWDNNVELKSKWRIDSNVNYTSNVNEADVIFIPSPVNYLSSVELSKLNLLCAKRGIKGYGYVIGDFGEVYKNYDSLIYFRVGGFKSQLPKNNIGLPVTLSDTFKKIYKTENIYVREKTELPIVGFCGHASFSSKQRFRSILSFIKKNITRFFKNPFRQDYEPVFASAYERAKLLKFIEHSKKIKAQFIYRNRYRAGAKTKQEMSNTMKEYYDNIVDSDYVLCVRGAGNFSVRLYETLMCGRIPVFIDTDCLLPFDDEIEWNSHIVRIPWSNRKNLANIISDFHSQIDSESFKQMQQRNRELWKTYLCVPRMMHYVEKQIKLSEMN